MSSVSLMENRSKYSTAMSVLNRVRHWLQRRNDIFVADKDWEVMREALDFDFFKTKESVVKAIMYNFQSYQDKGRSVSFQIASAISRVADMFDEKDREKYIDAVDHVVSNKSYDKLSEGDFEKAMEVITATIRYMSSVSEREYAVAIKHKDF